MLHQLFFIEYALFDLETLFFNIYFVTILYYAGSKLINRYYPDVDLPIKVLRGSYIALILVHLALFIPSLVLNSDRCLGTHILIQTTGI